MYEAYACIGLYVGSCYQNIKESVQCIEYNTLRLPKDHLSWADKSFMKWLFCLSKSVLCFFPQVSLALSAVSQTWNCNQNPCIHLSKEITMQSLRPVAMAWNWCFNLDHLGYWRPLWPCYQKNRSICMAPKASFATNPRQRGLQPTWESGLFLALLPSEVCWDSCINVVFAPYSYSLHDQLCQASILGPAVAVF